MQQQDNLNFTAAQRNTTQHSTAQPRGQDRKGGQGRAGHGPATCTEQHSPTHKSTTQHGAVWQQHNVGTAQGRSPAGAFLACVVPSAFLHCFACYTKLCCGLFAHCSLLKLWYDAMRDPNIIMPTPCVHAKTTRVYAAYHGLQMQPVPCTLCISRTQRQQTCIQAVTWSRKLCTKALSSALCMLISRLSWALSMEASCLQQQLNIATMPSQSLVVLCCAVLCCAVLCCAVLCCAGLCWAVLGCAVSCHDGLGVVCAMVLHAHSVQATTNIEQTAAMSCVCVYCDAA